MLAVSRSTCPRAVVKPLTVLGSKFKPISRPLLDPSSPPANKESIIKGVSPLTSMVLDKAPTFFQQTVAEAHGPTSLNGQLSGQSRPSSSKRTESPQLKSNAISNDDAHRKNVKIEVAIPAKAFDPSGYVEVADGAPPSAHAPASAAAKFTPVTDTRESMVSTPVGPQPAERPTTSGAKPQFAVELLNSTINKDEYSEIPDEPDEPSNLSSRRRQGQYDESQETLGASLDQRQRADGALHDLGRLTKDTFDAVGRVLQGESGFGHVAALTADREPALTAGCHQKLQSAIQKVIELGSFDQVPLDALVRTQKLAEVGLRSTQSLDYKVDDSWGESDVQSWLEQLPEVETGLKAARTTLRIMCGGREEKQLYSEEVIQQSIDLFKGVLDGIVVPVVELRGGSSSSTLFKLLHPHKKTVASILTSCQRLFALMTTLVQKIQLSDMAIGTLEFSASSLIFVDNAFYEKDSCVGVQKFDGIRLVAMDMLCQVFMLKPDQRKGIFNDLLTSLEKLPVGKQSARQFRLAEGGSIQPLSALIMRLVQASSGKVAESHEHQSQPADDEDDLESHPGIAPRAPAAQDFTIKSEEEGAQRHGSSVHELEEAVKPLTNDVQRDVSYVINFIVNRALKSSKSGDTPYRNLLDLFVEDFTTCMDSPDWPAAELLLRHLTYFMLKLWEDPKSAAPSKNMALELLGVMGAAISKLRSHVRKVAENKEGMSSDELARFLSELAMSALEQRNRIEHLVAWSGPYRATLEHLEERCRVDPHLKGAISCLIADWAHRTHVGYQALEDDSEERDQEYGRLAFRLRMMVEDRSWLSNEYTFKTVSPTQAKFSYSIILLRSPFCELFGAMLNALLSAMASDQATVRSKSLRSINQLLETDPAILDGDSVVVQLILDCSNDSSPQVRDSAIGLMGKCISLRRNLEHRMTGKILDRFLDSGVGVRKRAMKLARDIYLRNEARETRSAIANSLLHRVQDPDEGVRDLARQMIEEVWFAPFYKVDSTPAFKTSVTDHVALMIQTVKSGNVAPILDKVLQSILGAHAKSHHGPFDVSTRLVEKMFELIHNLDSDDPAIPHGRDALQVLQIFAKADPRLFTFEEIRLLKPHLANISSTDDLTVFKAVTAIYRQVLPHLSGKHADFLREAREQLQKCLTRLNKFILDDVVACLWIVACLLDNRSTVARIGGSSLAGTVKLRQGRLDDAAVKKFVRYAEIVGMVGKHCDLDAELEDFKGAMFAKWQGTSVTKLMVDQLSPWTDSNQPSEARLAALNAIGWICQAHPRNYVSPNVYPKFEQVFKEQAQPLEAAILRSFKEFLLTEEKRSEAAGAGSNGTESDKTRNLSVMGGTTYDDVASATTQRFLPHITRIALATLDEHAFLAVEVLGSINRQGLVHPKETGVTLITLETSPVHKISELAYIEHRTLHEKHESAVEREHAKAVQAAFNYQRDVVRDTHGATKSPFQSKLHSLMEVLKMSKTKNRHKFLEKLVGQIDFDPFTLDATAEMPPHVEFSRFVVENLAFFDYVTVGEVLATVNAIEKAVTQTGSHLAHTIDSEIFNVRMDVDQPGTQSLSSVPLEGELNGQPNSEQESQPAPIALNINPARLRQMTAGAIILLSLWEARTYLRRFYTLGSNRRESKSKMSSKDLSKAPIKAQGVTGDKFWEEVSNFVGGLSSQQSMVSTCRALVDLLNIDSEVKVANEDEDMDDEDPATPSAGEEGSPTDGRGRKRKAGGSTPGARKKRAHSASRPRPRGRPRKTPLPEEDDADGDVDFDETGDWF